LPAAAVTIAFLLVRQTLLAEPTQQGGLGHGAIRAPQLVAMLGHQTWYAFVPVGTLFDWQMPFGGPPWGAVLAAAIPVAGALWRPTRAASLWFLAALLPTLFVQAVVPLNILVADRFLLFALPGLAIAAARAADAGRSALVPGAAIIVCMGALTESAIP